MKKIMIATLIAMSLSVASAQYTGPKDSITPNNSQNQTAITVKEATALRDDSYVTMRGKVVKQKREDKYIFSDNTGSISIEIDKDKWRGLSIGPDDLVEVRGKIDKEWGTLEVDVDSIVKVQQ